MSDTALVQQKLQVPQTDAWDQNTQQALMAWQGSQGLDASGNPDPITLAAMQVYDPISGAPASFHRSLATGEEPGHFGRDFATVTNQVPRWAWVLVGLGFGGLAYLSWRRRGRGAQ